MTQPEPLEVCRRASTLHLFGTITVPADRSRSPGQAARRLGPAACSPVAVLGHKADLAIMALHADTVACCGACNLEAFAWPASRWSTATSVTEISEYAEAAAGVPEAMKQMRPTPSACPRPASAPGASTSMSKRRDPGANWLREDFDQRRKMMEEHGHSGRAFGERILQLVTASTGLDDHEWG
ncbi:MAG: chlorite dismutase family protein [Acidimicrobiales bacterium]